MELLGLILLIIVALGLVIFCVIVFTRGVFARDLTQAMQRVHQQEQALQAKAEILEQRLHQLERDYQAKLQRAEGEAKQIVEGARTLSLNVRSAAIEEAKHRARQLLLEAEQGRAHIKADVAKELDGRAIQQACEALRTLLPPKELTAVHHTLVEELLEAMRQLDTASLKVQVSHVDVTTGQSLPPAQSQQLAQWVVASLGATVPLHINADPALVAGCVVRMGSTIIDNSLAGRLAQPHSKT